MARVYNFAAGPSALYEDVLKQAQADLLDYQGCGMSVMEMSHRSAVYQDIIDQAEASFREVLGIPANYKVLFLQGGASTQFAMIPLNLMKNDQIDAVNTGAWTKKAIAEAKRYGQVNVVASSEDKNFNYIPTLDQSKFNPNADYFHVCTNNTIYGTRLMEMPDTGNVPIVADMSSNILSEEIDVSQFGLIFAGAQKNIGPAGLTMVVIREDLVTDAKEIAPVMLQYKTHVAKGSMYNTPPTFPIYMAKLCFEHIQKIGGLKAVQKNNEEKASLLYNYLDESKMFAATVQNPHRSLMNVPFITDSEEINAQFIKEASSAGFVNLKGHRSVGGMRASIYNAVSIEAVQALVDFMKKFETENK